MCDAGLVAHIDDLNSGFRRDGEHFIEMVAYQSEDTVDSQLGDCADKQLGSCGHRQSLCRGVSVAI
jgi:hypothetical protein